MKTHRLLQQGHPLIMGILNLTPDSFSDGGSHTDRGRAVSHALRMVEAGAAIIDVGGESTRPGSERVSAEEQQRRVLDVIKALRQTLPEAVAISIDTTLSEVARQAVEAGADILNDVSAGTEDPGMLELAADQDLPIVLMHMQGSPGTMQQNPSYTDVVAEVETYLRQRAEAATAAGIPAGHIILDPGIGFGKSRAHNLALMANLRRFVSSGYAVLLGASRKRFMGELCRETDPGQLLGATCATTVLGVQAGVRILRVHDVMANRQALEVALAIGNAATA